MNAAPDLAGRKLLLTGASGGIGSVLATALLAAGAHVALVGRRRTRLEAIASATPAGRAEVVLADLSTDDMEALTATCVETLGGIDGLVNCAGVVDYQAALAITPAALSLQVQVNFSQPLLLAQAVAKHMVPRGGGDIIAVTSTLAEHPAPMTAAYAGSKAALVAALRTLAIELGPQQVRVNAISPGVIDTDMVRVPRLQPGEAPLSEAEAEARVEAQLEQLARLHVLGRLGRAEDLVGALMYLLSSPWVTGSVLTVDGGLSLA